MALSEDRLDLFPMDCYPHPHLVGCLEGIPHFQTNHVLDPSKELDRKANYTTIIVANDFSRIFGIVCHTDLILYA